MAPYAAPYTDWEMKNPPVLYNVKLNKLNASILHNVQREVENFCKIFQYECVACVMIETRR